MPGSEKLFSNHVAIGPLQFQKWEEKTLSPCALEALYLQSVRGLLCHFQLDSVDL